uniref:Metalloendopeptidase n=1 Tax=Strongyloides papillosus TaxID=174720 RepID=A0A0N5C2V0_STREA
MNYSPIFSLIWLDAFITILSFLPGNISAYNNNESTASENTMLNKRSIKNSNSTNKDSESIVRNKRSLILSKKYRESFPINYYVDDKLNFYTIQAALAMIQMESCLTFRALNKPSRNKPGLLFIPKKSKLLHHLDVVRNYRIIKVFLSDTMPDVERKILLSLGMDYEHCRNDRNKYITLLHRNMRLSKWYKFDVKKPSNTRTYETMYDYGSFMHGNGKFESKNGLPTIIPKNYLYRKTMGQNIEMSFLDIKRLNLFYCASICRNKKMCLNGSFQSPTTCDCLCVPGFIGPRCETLQSVHMSCGKTLLSSGNRLKHLSVKGKKRCVYHITSPAGTKLIIKVSNSYIKSPEDEVCKPSNNLEIKYLNDKTTTGVRLCGNDRNVLIVSEGSHVMVIFNSLDRFNTFSLFYRNYIYGSVRLVKSENLEDKYKNRLQKFTDI